MRFKFIKVFIAICLSQSAFGQFFTVYPIRKMRPDSNVFTNVFLKTRNEKMFISNISKNILDPNFKFGLSEVSDSGFAKNDTSSVLDGINQLNSVNSLAFYKKDSSYWAPQNGFSADPSTGLYRYKNKKWTFLSRDSIQGWPKQVPGQPRIRMESISNDPNPEKLLLFGFYEQDKNEIFEFFPLERKLISVYKISGLKFSFSNPFPILSNGTLIIFGYPEFVLEKNLTSIKEVPNAAYGLNFKYIYNLKTHDDSTFWVGSSQGIAGGTVSRVKNGVVKTLGEIAQINNQLSNIDYAIEKKGGKIWFTSTDGIGSYSERKGTREFLRFEYDYWGIGWTGGIAQSIGIEIDTNNVKWLLTENNLVKIEDVKTTILNKKAFAYACKSPNFLLKQQTTTFGEGIKQYKWNISNGTELFGDSVKVSFPFPGKYSITLTALDSNGSKAKDTLEVEILPLPQVQVLASLADTIKTCTFPLTLKAATNPGFRAYTWKSQNGEMGQDSIFRAGAVGQYVLTVDFKNEIGSCLFSDSIFIKQKVFSGLVIHATLDNNETFSSPGKFSTESIPPIQIEFVLDDELVADKDIDYRLEIQNQNVPQRTEKVYDYQANLGKYEVKAFGYTKDSCYVEAKMELELLPIVLKVPNLVSQNKDERNDTFIIKGLEKYWQKGAKLGIEIFNRWGKKIYESQDYKNDWPSDNQEVGGNYFFHLKPAYGEQFEGWVLLQK